MTAADRAAIEKRSDAVRKALFDHVDRADALAVIQAPPGSGKTWLLLQAVARAREAGARVAVAAQTNAQVDDVCRRLARDHPKVNTVRFAAESALRPPDLPKKVVWETKSADLPSKPCVVVGTAAKWGLVKITTPFDFLFVEEAWQLAWADFMLLGQVSSRFVLIGDPGQIPPVVPIDVSRWETSPRPPHMAAPEVILGDPSLSCRPLFLPGTRRLPYDTTELIKPFYPFDFASWATPGERAVETRDKGRQRAVDATIDLLPASTAVAMTLPTPDGGPPLEQDDEIAETAVKVALRLLERRAVYRMDGKTAELTASDIGLAATHRVMNAAMALRLPKKLRADLRVDTPERWQGLERKVMIVVHPLSGVTRPSAFDLETGRLCVMASRHQAGLIVVGRDHLSTTLREYLPVADQAVGRPDVAGRGHARNLAFWGALERAGRIVSL